MTTLNRLLHRPTARVLCSLLALGGIAGCVSPAVSGQSPETAGIAHRTYFRELPEGNYRVRLTFGDEEAPSRTTVKAETRRLMVESLETREGESVTRLLPREEFILPESPLAQKEKPAGS